MRKSKRKKVIYYFIQQKVIEVLLVVGAFFAIYLLGHVERIISVIYFPIDPIMCQGIFSCFGAGLLVIALLFMCLMCLGGVILLIGYPLIKLIEWNWEKAKERARSGRR